MNYKNTWIVIPTYWGPHQVGDFDHPTPLDGESTLPRLLDSLCQLTFDGPFQVLIITAVTDPAAADLAVSRVQKICEPYLPYLSLHIIGPAEARRIHDQMQDPGFQCWLGLDQFNSYAAVRNMQLIYPIMNGAELIVAVDDDEVVPPNYLNQAHTWIWQPAKEGIIHGVCGPYLDLQGSPYIPAPESVQNPLKDKSYYMNKAMWALMAGQGTPSPSPMALGGNMVFDAWLAERVCFDPAVLRGEDIDYLINARGQGINFYFDPALTITHLPPRQYESDEYAKRGRDVRRFLYEQIKIRQFGLRAEDFGAYPGHLMGIDLTQAAEELLCEAEPQQPDAGVQKPKEIIQETINTAGNAVSAYHNHLMKWQVFIKGLKNNSHFC